MIVSDKNICLVPFSILPCLAHAINSHQTSSLPTSTPIHSPNITTGFLSDRFNITITPSLHLSTVDHSTQEIRDREASDASSGGAVIVGNSSLPPSVTSRWGWRSEASMQGECQMMGEILGCQPLMGVAATRKNVLRELCQASEICHFVTDISSRFSSIVLSCGAEVLSKSNSMEFR